MPYELYSKEVMKHFLHPKNMGKIKNPDGTGKVGNIVCGDVMWLYIKIKNKKITDIKFNTFGCVAAIATSSMVTELAKGKSVEDAMKITKDDILNNLSKLPPIKNHCSVLAIDALNEALYDYFSKNKQPLPKRVLKNHERIQHTLKIIETRHKEFLELENQILEKRS